VGFEANILEAPQKLKGFAKSYQETSRVKIVATNM
jgi:hypothetical protein